MKTFKITAPADISLHRKWDHANWHGMSPVHFAEQVETIATEQRSVAGCLSGSYSWGDQWHGSVDGREWVRLDTPSRTHTQNSAPTGWERRGTSEKEGSVGLSGWRAYRYLVRLYVGPEVHSGDRYLGKTRSVTLVRVPRCMRPTSFARRARRAAEREERAEKARQ